MRAGASRVRWLLALAMIHEASEAALVSGVGLKRVDDWFCGLPGRDLMDCGAARDVAIDNQRPAHNFGIIGRHLPS